MNAAARLVHQKILSRRLVLTYFSTRQRLGVWMLAFAVLFSMLGIIYVTHTTRIMHATYQHQLADQDRLQLEQGQLLLERSAWMMQSRIENMAEHQLGMTMPSGQSIVTVRE